MLTWYEYVALVLSPSITICALIWSIYSSKKRVKFKLIDVVVLIHLGFTIKIANETSFTINFRKAELKCRNFTESKELKYAIAANCDGRIPVNFSKSAIKTCKGKKVKITIFYDDKKYLIKARIPKNETI